MSYCIDSRTVILLLAIGSFVFFGLLLVYQFRKEASQRTPFWAGAKLLQAVGSLLLFWRGQEPGFVTVATANNLLLLGCAYEGWAVCYLVGRAVPRRVHVAVACAIVTICLSTFLLTQPGRALVVFSLHTLFYALPAAVLLAGNVPRSLLRTALGGSYLLLSLLFLAYFSWLALDVLQKYQIVGSILATAITPAVYCMLIMSGFSMLLMVKEKSDSELKRAQDSLRIRDEQYRRIVDTAIEGILSLDTQACITFANRQMASLLGYDLKELMGKPLREFLAPDFRNAHAQQIKNREQGLDAVYETCFVRKDGQRHWLLVSAKAICDDDGQYQGSFGMFTDIDERKKVEAALEESNRKLQILNKTDELTGIANRRHFDVVMAEEYARHTRSGQSLSLILIDVDHFKAYNDRYGHVAGDACLRSIAGVLAANASRANDLAARYGGEEFACILPMTDLPGACAIAEKIRLEILGLDMPHPDSSPARVVTVSLGVAAMRCSRDNTFSDLIAAADKLLYAAKAAGRNCVKCPDRAD